MSVLSDSQLRSLASLMLISDVMLRYFRVIFLTDFSNLWFFRTIKLLISSTTVCEINWLELLVFWMILGSDKHLVKPFFRFTFPFDSR